MHGFTDCAATDGAERLISLVSRLTLLRPNEGDPLDTLRDFAGALLYGDVSSAYELYHALARQLVTGSARRVSGDLLMDHILALVIEREHPFAKTAASGKLEEAEKLAFCQDLAALGELASIKSNDLVRMVRERARDLQQLRRHPKDEISAMSAALWSGKTLPPPPLTEKIEKAPALPLPLTVTAPAEAEWLPFQYGEAGLRGEWTADEALEEVYSRLMKSTDWRALADDLWNLFATSGSGIFLRSRTFEAKGNSLECVKPPQWLCPVSIYDRQRMALSENVIAFMRGESDTPVLIWGPACCGKTTLMRDLAEDFPELRIVFVDDAAQGDIREIVKRLREQPLRFLLLLDNMDRVPASVRSLLHEIAETEEPGNVLIASTACEEHEPGLFPITLALRYPRISEYTDTVCELIEAFDNTVALDRGEIRSICVDYQVDAHEKLTMTAAVMLARQYIAHSKN